MTTNENRIAVDTETGGFESQVETHALLSIAAVASWGCPPFYVKIQPDGLIDPGAAAKNGYTPERWADALPVKVALLEFQRWLHESGAKEKGAVPLAHNAGFDRTWLRHREAREGIALGLGHRWRCSQASMGFLIDQGELEAESTSLDELGRLSGYWELCPRSAAHDALEDARATLHGYQWLLAHRNADEIELASIKDHLWPNQTGLPNQHRNALICIQRREQLARERLAALEQQLAEKEGGAAA